jgi:Tol biopolymer transport system component
MTGTTVGHYEILERIGEGGMGVVYKGRDLLLNRTLALKFLPASNAADDDSRRRIVHEARAASALNHPNIVTVYEVAHAGGRPYIAMELVQGRSLDEVIGGRPLPLRAALDYGIQVADALSAAHAAGIVHRDLKPGNVMVTGSGLVKVLDFGLAKIVAIPAAESDATQLVLDKPESVEGLVLGTVSYMSPEQAQGRPVDPRSDIFAFGVLMYEMLTGRRAFQGDSPISTLSAILTTDPAPLAGVSADLPLAIVRIVERCLRKLAAERWQSVADVRIALEDCRSDLQSGRFAVRGSSAAPGRTPWITIAAAVATTAAVTGVAAWLARPAPLAPERWSVRRLTADAGASLSPAISRDGTMVAYVSDRAAADSMDLWVQQIGGGDPVQLTRNLGVCYDPAFSPDGSRIVLRCGDDAGSIYVVPTLGGLPKKLGDGELPQFSPDGSLISYLAPAPRNARSNTIWIRRSDGSAPRQITIDKTLFHGPVWRPDGKGFLIVGFNDPETPNDRDWFFVSAENGALSPTGAVAYLKTARMGFNTAISVARDGLLFTQGDYDSGSIYRMPFDAGFRAATGEPSPIVVGPGFYVQPTASQDGRRITFAIGNNLTTNIWHARLDPGTGKVAGEPVRVTSGLEASRTPSPSRDGGRVAYLGGSASAPEIRVRDLTSGGDVRLAAAKVWSFLTLSADGSTVAFNTDQRDGSAIYSVPVTGGVPKKICGACGRPVEWSPDRTSLYFDGAGPEQREIHVLDVATGKSRLFLRSEEKDTTLTLPRLSRDGRFMTFTMVRPGRARRIYLAPVTNGPVPTNSWTVVAEGSNLERMSYWAPSGEAIYFLSERDGFRCIWAQRVDAATHRPSGEPFGALHMHQARYSLGSIPDVATIGLSIAGDQLFYAGFELQANVWLAERRQ